MPEAIAAWTFALGFLLGALFMFWVSMNKLKKRNEELRNEVQWNAQFRETVNNARRDINILKHKNRCLIAALESARHDLGKVRSIADQYPKEKEI